MDSENTITIDAVGQVCPYPLITVRRALKDMNPGDVLKLVVDYEQSAVKSIPEWCAKNNVKFEVEQIEDRLWYVYVEKPL